VKLRDYMDALGLILKTCAGAWAPGSEPVQPRGIATTDPNAGLCQPQPFT
jgi:hypothetical protein